MNTKCVIWSVCLCALLASSCTPKAQLQEQITSTLADNDSVGMMIDSPVLLTGGGGRGWVVVRKDGMFDLLSHSAAGAWEWAGVDIQGQVTAACSDTQGQLLLMTHAPNAMLVIGKDGHTPQIGPAVPRAHWPDSAQAVAACMRPGGEGNGETCLILLAGTGETDDTLLTLLALSGNTWQSLGTIAPVTGKGLHYALATSGGRVYLQITTDQGGWLYQSPMREAQLAADDPRPLKWTRQATSPATTLLTVGGSLYRLALTPEGDQWSLTMGPLDPNAPAAMPTNAITLDTEPLRFPTIPQACGFGDQIALLWYDGQEAKYTFADAHGAAEPARDLIKLNSPPPNTDGVKLYQYLFGGLIGLTLVAMFVIPAKAPLGPVILPVIYRPAPLIKRLLAAAIDLMLLSLPVTIYLGKNVPQPAVQNWEAWVDYQTACQVFLASYQGAVVMITSLTVFLIYCVMMEMRFGATIGKAIFGLKVVSANGLPLGWREAIIRNTTKVLLLRILYLPVLIMALNPARQRLGDMFGRSVVVARTGATLPEGVSLEDLYRSLQTGRPPEQDPADRSDDSAE